MDYIHIDTIDFSACDLLKENKLFFDPSEQIYYKLWEEGAILWDRKLGDLFLLAINSGFYDGLAQFEAVLISDNGTCVGYAMRAFSCPMKDTDGIIQGNILRHKNRHDFNIFNDAPEQDGKYQRFYAILTENAEKTGFFFYDLVQSNIADLDDRYCIIDIESIAHIRDLYKIPKYHLECIPVDYFEFLQNLYKKKVSLSSSGINMQLIEQAWTMSTGGMDRKPYYSVVINGKSFKGERAWNLRWTKFKEAMDWKGLKILDLGTCMGMVPAFLLKYYELHSATAIDCNPHHIEATNLVKRAFRIPEERMRIIDIDLNNSAYEDILGYDYNVIFCLSFLRWVTNKERFLKYLSNFKNIILEAHDLDRDVITIFKDIGFIQHKLLGESRIGRSFPENEKRAMYHFWIS
jgi:hypothetical protein